PRTSESTSTAPSRPSRRSARSSASSGKRASPARGCAPLDRATAGQYSPFMASLARSLSKVAAAGLLALGAPSPPSAAPAEIRIGVVDANYAVSQTEDGIRATNTLRRMFEKKQKDVDAKKADLEKMRDDIERQTRVLSREAITRRMEDWQKRMVELQTVFA